MPHKRIYVIRENDWMWCATKLHLGPLFFLLYINDLPQCLSKTKPRLFADDTNLAVSDDSITFLKAAVNFDLENLRKWLIENKLALMSPKSMIKIQMIKSISNLQPIKCGN